MWLTSGLHRHVASTSAKPGNKTARWSKMNGFKSWMIKDTRFWSSMAKIKPRQELDGQKWTFSEPTLLRVGMVVVAQRLGAFLF